MVDEHIYKVGLIIRPPNSYIDINNNYESVLHKLWIYISNVLKKKGYKFKNIRVEEVNLQKNIENVSNGVYDILICETWIIKERLDIVSMTMPLFLSTPVIFYDSRIENVNKSNYYFHILKAWIIPFFFIIFICIILSFFHQMENKKSVGYNMFNTILLFIANRNMMKLGLIHKALTLIIVFSISLLISMKIIKDSVYYYRQLNELNINIKGKTFYCLKGSYANKIIKKYKGKTIEVDEPFLSYERDKFKGDIHGFIFGDLHYHQNMQDDQYLKKSKILLDYFPVGLCINKKHTKFVKDINLLIMEMKTRGIINDVCEKYSLLGFC